MPLPPYVLTQALLIKLWRAHSMFSTPVGFLLVLWFDITHTNTHTHEDTQHTQGPVNWHAHINIYLYHLLCSHSSYLYYTEWITHWYQKFTFHNVFSFQKLCACKVIYLLIRCYESRFFLWNTNNTDRNGVNKQKTHTPNTQRKITLERVS